MLILTAVLLISVMVARIAWGLYVTPGSDLYHRTALLRGRLR